VILKVGRWGDGFGIDRHFPCQILAAPCSTSCDRLATHVVSIATHVVSIATHGDALSAEGDCQYLAEKMVVIIEAVSAKRLVLGTKVC
jgi:hypothetical protein